MNRILTLEEITAAVKQYAPQYNLRRVWLFGSYARGEATLQSDLDFCIEYGEDAEIFDKLCLIDDLQDHFGVHVDMVSLEALGSEDKAFKSNILQDRALLYRNDAPPHKVYFAALKSKNITVVSL